MQGNFSIIFDYIVNNYGTENIFWIFYVMNIIFSVIAYKLGFARKLSLLKSIFVYILLIIGTYIVTIFSVLKMPITESLIIISVVLAIYRLRLHRERKQRTEDV